MNEAERKAFAQALFTQAAAMSALSAVLRQQAIYLKAAADAIDFLKEDDLKP